MYISTAYGYYIYMCVRVSDGMYSYKQHIYYYHTERNRSFDINHHIPPYSTKHHTTTTKQQQTSNRTATEQQHKGQTPTMIGLAYTAFVVPIPTANDYNAFVTNLPLPPSLKGRLSTSSTRSSSASLTQLFSHGIPETRNDNDGGVVGNGNGVAGRRSSRRGGVLLQQLRVLVDGRVRLRRTGYVLVEDEAIELQ
ncbi:hypothetical protein J3F83DRAFT_740672 [Trichoderma novae-zelandiae]